MDLLARRMAAGAVASSATATATPAAAAVPLAGEDASPAATQEKTLRVDVSLDPHNLRNNVFDFNDLVEETTGASAVRGGLKA
jgi:hypothetical protein